MSHIHRYTRVNLGHGNKEYWVMKCNLPSCTSYTPGQSKLSFPLLRDQIAICNKCGEKFTLNRRALRMAKPICDECVNTKVKIEVESAKDFFDDLMRKVVE